MSSMPLRWMHSAFDFLYVYLLFRFLLLLDNENDLIHASNLYSIADTSKQKQKIQYRKLFSSANSIQKPLAIRNFRYIISENWRLTPHTHGTQRKEAQSKTYTNPYPNKMKWKMEFIGICWCRFFSRLCLYLPLHIRSLCLYALKSYSIFKIGIRYGERGIINQRKILNTRIDQTRNTHKKTHTHSNGKFEESERRGMKMKTKINAATEWIWERQVNKNRSRQVVCDYICCCCYFFAHCCSIH